MPAKKTTSARGAVRCRANRAAGRLSQGRHAIALKPATSLRAENIFPAREEIQVDGKIQQLGRACPGAGRPRKPRGVPITAASEVWPAADLVEASPATVEVLARLQTRAALTTLLLIAERGSDEGVQVSAASKLLDIAELGALRRPPRPRRH